MAIRADLPHQPPRERRVSARTQLLVSSSVGLVAGAAGALVFSVPVGVLVGWDAAAAVYVAWVVLSIWRLDADDTARFAAKADPTRATTDLLLLSAAVASLAAVGVVIVRAAQMKGSSQDLGVALGLASVVLSWATVHTVYALRYAAIYHTGPDGGVRFPGDERPRYTDFVYLALTIGMTFQVSDTDLQTSDLRRTAVQHALLSYLFGTGVLATTINLVASLSSQG